MPRTPLYFMMMPVMAGVVLGFGYFDSFDKGSPIPGVTALNASLGGLRSQPVNSPAGLFLNPGELGLLEGVTASLDGGVLSWKEVVIDTTSSVHRGDDILGAATGGLAVRAGFLVVALGFAKVADFDYAGTNNTVNPYTGSLESVEVAWVSGSQWEYLGGIGGTLPGGIHAGFSGGIRTVGVDYDYVFIDKTIFGRDSTASWRVSGQEFCWHAGLVTVSELVTAGLSYSSATEYHSPTLALSGSVVSPHINNTRTGFEGELSDPFNRNDFTGKLFFATPITESFTLRSSVIFDEGHQADRTSLGFGLGGDYNRGNSLGLSLGCLWRSRSRRGSAFPNETADRVNDSSISLVLGSVYSF